MNDKSQATQYFIGWDVGGWNCDKNAKSRDAIVIHDSGLSIDGMHVLAKFTPDTISCGVWTGGEMPTAIEAYPSACKDWVPKDALNQR